MTRCILIRCWKYGQYTLSMGPIHLLWRVHPIHGAYTSPVESTPCHGAYIYLVDSTPCDGAYTSFVDSPPCDGLQTSIVESTSCLGTYLLWTVVHPVMEPTQLLHTLL